MRRWLITLLFSAGAIAQTSAERAVSILRENCAGCHGAAVKMSKLDLRTRESILAGGAHGPAIQPGDPEKSRLFRLIAGLDKPAMPPTGKLRDEQIAALRVWIEEGAPMPESAQNSEPQYWAFRPPVRPPVPNVGTPNPVDAFLRAAMRVKGLKPSQRADRRSLIRRAYLDLIGLPPTPEQVNAFVNDQSPHAFSKVVEELLASPHYGERWGRHWLDLVRYADSAGFEFDRDRPNAFRYRDYVIRAFNEDKPYDRFLKEQIAGDELWPDSAEARTATGFLRLGLENNLKNEQTRLDELDDVVSTTSNVFLALTIGCARCHDHKFDPIPQKDYYRVQAVFYPAKPHEFPLVPADEVARFEKEKKRITDLQAPFKEQLKQLEQPYRDRLLDEKKSKLPPYIQLALRTPPEKRTEGQRLNAAQVEKTLMVEPKELTAALSPADLEQYKQLSAKIEELEKQRPKPFPTAMSVTEAGREPRPTHLLHRGSPGQKGEVVQPGVLSAVSGSDVPFAEPPADTSTSWRRRAFAEWLASPENPLTARVMVNRIWQHHFGEGIVRTPNNFGKMGERPTHPELLDWLAAEFVKSGWSIKAMHRLMMNSESYQMASTDIPANVAIDRDNRYLWRMPRRRIEAEGIRDSILALAGNLDRTVGGPAVHPYIDPALFQSSSKRTWPGRPDSDPSTWRRSVYVFTKRSIPLPMLDVFDKPDSVSSCARRNRSTIAPQALILMNNAFVLMEAGMFAERIRKEAGTDPAGQVDRVFQLALSRKPTPRELEQSTAFLRTGEHALADLCQVMFNLNEFAFIP